MKHLFLVALLSVCFVTAFAQFPLGSKPEQIKAYFDNHISYASAQEFTTKEGNKGLCFTKVRIIGDYTFYFDAYGYCTYYVVTYGTDELPGLLRRFDYEFCRVENAQWKSDDNSFSINLVLPKSGQNYFSIIYKPLMPGKQSQVNSLASN